MKKHLLFLCALLLTTLGARAQSSITLSNSSWYAGSGTTTSASDYGSYAKENYNDSGHSAGVLLHQTITGLTANANYVIEFFAAVNQANGTIGTSGEDYAQVYAGSTTKDITVETKGASDFPNGSEANILAWGDAYHHILLATADASGQIDFGVQNVTAAGNWAIAYAVSATLIDSEWTGNATAHKCTTGGGSDNAAPTSWTSLNGNVFPGLHINKHSTEADASGMVTPFVEYWYGSTSAMVTPETLSHTQLTGLPEGEYTISVDARIMSGSGATIGEGTKFNANDASVDLIGGTEDTYGTETEVYGTYHLIAEVDTTGTLDISFSVPETVTYNWLAWKNLDIVYMGESLPTLDYVTGTMNKDIVAAMQAAVDAYNTSKSADDYAAALEAIDAAEASVAYYANVKDAIESVLPTITLDELGTAAWENGSFLAGYNAQTLTNESVTAAFISAEASQAAGTELVYALTANEWICSTNGDGQGNGPSDMNPGYETYTSGSYVAGKVMYQRLSDLPAGYSYKVEFYGSAKSVNGGGNSVTGTGTAVAFANDKQQAVSILSEPNANDLLTGGYLRTFNMVTVDEDNALEYGLMNVATGGNWYMCDNYKITILGVVEDAIIGDAKASAEYVAHGQEVSITFEVTAPSDEYTLVGSDFTSSEGISVTYSGEGVFTFTVPDDASGTFTVTIPAGQLYYTYGDEKVTNEEGSNAATTLTFTVPFTLSADLTSGMFLKNLYNNDLLSRGKDVGTRADVDFVGIPVTLTMNDEGKYTIWYADADQSRADATHQSYLYGPNWVYANGSASQAATFSVEEVKDTDGTLLGYHFVSDYGLLYRYDATAIGATDINDDYALALNGVKGENYSDDSQAIWTFVDKDERNSLKAAWVADQKMDVAQKAGLTKITSADEFDEFVAEQTETSVYSSTLATEAIVTADWTVSGTPGYNADGYAYGVEAYYGNDPGYARLSHEITGLNEGVYKLTLNGLDRNSTPEYSTEMYNEGYTDLSESYLEANGHEINLQPWASEAYWSDSYYYPNWMNESSEMFESGSYLNTLYTYVGEDGVLDINIALLVTEYFGWATVKNLNVYYLGELEFGEDKDYDKGDEVTFDGTTYTVVTGENLFVNGGFNEGVTGWTAGSGYTDALASNAVTYTWSGGYNGNPYITLPSSVGAANAATPTQAIAVEAGKSYLFVGYTKGTAPTEGNLRYSALFEMDYNGEGKLAEKNHDEDGTSYSNTIIQLEWGNGSDELNGWTKTEGVFTVPTENDESTYGTYSYVGMRMNWSTGSYDGFQLYEVEEPTEIEWTLGADYGTLILPFDYDLTDTGLTAYTGAINGATMELTAVESNQIAAYTPYIIGGAEAAQTTYTFSGVPGTEEGPITDSASGLVGVLETTAAPAGSYVLQNQEENGLAFYLVESDETITVGAYHCYLDGNVVPAGAKAITFSFGDETATGIDAVESESEAGSGVIYDLGGRRVAKAQKGIYIVDGKKVVIK